MLIKIIVETSQKFRYTRSAHSHSFNNFNMAKRFLN